MLLKIYKSMENSNHYFPWLLCAIWSVSAAFSVVGTQSAYAEDSSTPTVNQAESSKLSPSDDGWADLSEFIDKAYGFMPLIIPITEPAVGYGAAGALAFIDKPNTEDIAGFGRPNITVVGGLRTENGTKGGFAGDIRYWMDDRLKTMIGAVDASVNLDFYGIGLNDALTASPRRYNLDTQGGMLQANYRLHNSKYWLGLNYLLADTKIEFDVLPQLVDLPNYTKESRISGLTPSLIYDSRDTIFTPTAGSYYDLSVELYSQYLGSDFDFQRLNLTGIHYWPLHQKVTLGVIAGAIASFGDVPFYLYPFINLRGAPKMRYQGEQTAQVEAELRWQFWKRFSLIGFAGMGAAWNEFEKFENEKDVTTGGVGFRYEIARKYDLHVGIDAAFGPDGTAYYVQFGSAWMRP